jgi:thiol:disulfide interchange protein
MLSVHGDRGRKMRMHGLLARLVLLLAIWLPVQAWAYAETVTTEHTAVTLRSDVTAVQPGVPFWIGLQFDLQPDWHVYWRNPGDSGLPVTLEWKLPKGFEAGDIRWPAPARIPVDTLINYGYHGSEMLLVKVTPPVELQPAASYILRLDANWLVCKDVCIPESGQLMLVLQTNLGEEMAVSPYAADIEQALSNLPEESKTQALFREVEKNLEITLTLPEKWKDKIISKAYFFPEEAGVIRHDAEQVFTASEGTLTLSIPRDTQALPEQVKGVWDIEVKGEGELVYDVTHQPAPKPVTTAEAAGPKEAVDTLSLLQALVFAFLGGVLLNAMPCVFPVLSLKAISISRKAQHAPRVVRKYGLMYALGVIMSFVALGLLMIGLQRGGEEIGWGFQLQSPVFVAALVYLFVLLSLALTGLFHLPVMFGSIGIDADGHDTSKGSFLTGILAVLVATPCSVPFMAPAVGYAFAQPPVVTLLIMAALGVGLAFPYLLLSFFPATRKWLPKPGPWMQRFKEFMTFPLLATAIWLLWVLAQQASADAVGMVLSVCLLLVFLIWLGRGRRKFYRHILSLAGGVLVVISLMSLQRMSPEPSPGSISQMEEADVPVEHYSAARLAELRKEGKAVFVNATAAWCITCKLNERVALRSEAVMQAMREQDVVYMKADWTNRDDAITELLESFNRRGVPLYVYYPPRSEPVVLPQLLTPGLVVETLKGEKP